MTSLSLLAGRTVLTIKRIEKSLAVDCAIDVSQLQFFLQQLPASVVRVNLPFKLLCRVGLQCTLPTLKIIKHVKIKLHKMHVMVLFSVKIAVKEMPALYQSLYVIAKKGSHFKLTLYFEYSR